MADPWQPANPVESALADAVAAGDRERYCAVLAESVLLVPVVAAGSGDGSPPSLASMRLADGVVVVPAYTSPQAMARPEAEPLTGRHLPVPFARLAAGWPDSSWVLAVDAGLPVAGYLRGVELAAVVAMVFAPVNETERRLSAAGRPADALAVLATAPLHLPVRPGGGGGSPAEPGFAWFRWEPGGGWGPGERAAPVVPAFTSRRRLRGCLGLAHPEIEPVEVDLATLAAAWPDPQWMLVVNPGAPAPVVLAGDRLRELAREPRQAGGPEHHRKPPAG